MQLIEALCPEKDWDKNSPKTIKNTFSWVNGVLASETPPGRIGTFATPELAIRFLQDRLGYSVIETLEIPED